MDDWKHLKPGEKWICKKDVVMIEGYTAYFSGKLYKCELPDCLTDERGCKDHYWTEFAITAVLFFEYFRRIPRNKRSKWTKRN